MKRNLKVQPITRSFHCPKCEAENRPKAGDTFVTLGTTGKLKMHKYEGGGVTGITPHFVLLETERLNIMKLLVSCCIHGCGVDIFTEGNICDFEFDVIETRNIKMARGDYNALKEFKDKDYYI